MSRLFGGSWDDLVGNPVDYGQSDWSRDQNADRFGILGDKNGNWQPPLDHRALLGGLKAIAPQAFAENWALAGDGAVGEPIAIPVSFSTQSARQSVEPAQANQRLTGDQNHTVSLQGPDLATATAGGNDEDGSASAGNSEPGTIDPSFILGSEGYQLQTYLPDPLNKPAPSGAKDPGRNVGITVARGIDLGSHSLAELKRWGVSEAGIAALQPMLGLKGQAARAYYNAHGPVTISQADAEAMDRGALNDILTGVAAAYDATEPKTKFAQLPGSVRTAIIDLGYQYGTNLPGKTPKFWRDITKGDWAAAARELNDFGDHYSSRRKREATELQRGLKGLPGF